MHFEHLTVENLGPFMGTQQMRFSSQDSRSITVICGGNASGKTILLGSLGWALGGLVDDSRTNYLLYENERAFHPFPEAKVTLRFVLKGCTYESCRRWQRDAHKLPSDRTSGQVDLRVQCADGRWQTHTEPLAFLASTFPIPLRDVIYGPAIDNHSEASGWWRGMLRNTNFQAWASRRLQGADPLAMDVLKAWLAGDDYPAGMGAIHLARLYLLSWFREWLFGGDNLPAEWQHLRGESLPWLLDNPFAMLSIPCRLAAARLLEQIKSQLIVAASPNGVQSPVDGILSHRTGARCLLRTGGGFGDGYAELFGERLALCREDNRRFTEIVDLR